MRALAVVSLILLAGAIFGAWFLYPAWIQDVFTVSEDQILLSRLGTFGDSFGTLNTLFSGLAFAGIIISIILQSRELKETRKELQGQKEQFQIQNTSLKRQVFENTFFQLLYLHNEITSAISIRAGLMQDGQEVRGRAAITAMFTIFAKQEHHRMFPEPPRPTTRKADYELFHQLHHDQIGHYFRNVYQIIKFVNESSVDNKAFYASLLRAQLSSDELALLYFNCISDFGTKRFKPLVEQYSLLEHLPVYDVFKKEDAVQFKPEAFGDSEEWKAFLKA